MAPVSVHSLGISLQSSFGVSVTRASPDCSSGTAGKLSFPSLSLLLWPPAPGLGAMSRGAAEPRAEKQQLQQRTLFVKMKPVCASVPVSRLACPAALS